MVIVYFERPYYLRSYSLRKVGTIKPTHNQYNRGWRNDDKRRLGRGERQTKRKKGERDRNKIKEKTRPVKNPTDFHCEKCFK